MTTAVSTMIINSLVMTGDKELDGTLNATEQSYYLSRMNSMMESWGLDRTLVYTILQENFALTAGTASYTIGPGGTFNTSRPTKIENAFTRDASNFDNPVVIIPQDRYAAVKVKTTGNSYPQWLYYDAAEVGGLATIYLYPAPVASLTLYINSYQPLQSFASVTTALTLPPGYQRAIESNFAIEVAPAAAKASAELVRIAKESKAAIRGINLPELISRVDAAVARSMRGNIITGP